jgi:hypothetical protein
MSLNVKKESPVKQKDGQTIEATYHSIVRTFERFDLRFMELGSTSKEVVENVAKLAYTKGFGIDNCCATFQTLRNWFNDFHSQPRNKTNALKIYGVWGFIFTANGVLITITPVKANNVNAALSIQLVLNPDCQMTQILARENGVLPSVVEETEDSNISQVTVEKTEVAKEKEKSVCSRIFDWVYEPKGYKQPTNFTELFVEEIMPKLDGNQLIAMTSKFAGNVNYNKKDLDKCKARLLKSDILAILFVTNSFESYTVTEVTEKVTTLEAERIEVHTESDSENTKTTVTMEKPKFTVIEKTSVCHDWQKSIGDAIGVDDESFLMSLGERLLTLKQKELEVIVAKHVYEYTEEEIAGQYSMPLQVVEFMLMWAYNRIRAE